MPGEDIYSWSTTAANNDSADPLIDWREGMARAAVNDSARSLMAAIAKQRDLQNGSIITAGTANAQSFTSGIGYTEIPTGLRVILQIGPSLTNTTAATLDMDSIGPVAIKNQLGGELGGGELNAGSYREFLYNGTNWLLFETTTNQTIQITETTNITSAAAVDFTANIDDSFLEYRFIFTNILPATNLGRLSLRLSNDAGVTWKTSGYRRIRSDTFGNVSSALEFYSYSQSDSFIQMSHQLSSNSAFPLHGSLTLSAPYLTGLANPMIWQMASWDGTNMNYTAGAGCYVFGGPINAVRFLMDVGNIASGDIALFGIGRR